jgi:hypothetical protein
MAVNINGDLVTGKEARVKITEESISKSSLNIRDLEFILTKLKSATYKGTEFEHFYSVWVKLSSKLQSLKTNK